MKGLHSGLWCSTKYLPEGGVVTNPKEMLCFFFVFLKNAAGWCFRGIFPANGQQGASRVFLFLLLFAALEFFLSALESCSV